MRKSAQPQPLRLQKQSDTPLGLNQRLPQGLSQPFSQQQQSSQTGAAPLSQASRSFNPPRPIGQPGIKSVLPSLPTMPMKSGAPGLLPPLGRTHQQYVANSAPPKMRQQHQTMMVAQQTTMTTTTTTTMARGLKDESVPPIWNGNNNFQNNSNNNNNSNSGNLSRAGSGHWISSPSSGDIAKNEDLKSQIQKLESLNLQLKGELTEFHCQNAENGQQIKKLEEDMKTLREQLESKNQKLQELQELQKVQEQQKLQEIQKLQELQKLQEIQKLQELHELQKMQELRTQPPPQQQKTENSSPFVEECSLDLLSLLQYLSQTPLFHFQAGGGEQASPPILSVSDAPVSPMNTQRDNSLAQTPKQQLQGESGRLKRQRDDFPQEDENEGMVLTWNGFRAELVVNLILQVLEGNKKPEILVSFLIDFLEHLARSSGLSTNDHLVIASSLRVIQSLLETISPETVNSQILSNLVECCCVRLFEVTISDEIVMFALFRVLNCVYLISHRYNLRIEPLVLPCLRKVLDDPIVWNFDVLLLAVELLSKMNPVEHMDVIVKALATTALLRRRERYKIQRKILQIIACLISQHDKSVVEALLKFGTDDDDDENIDPEEHIIIVLIDLLEDTISSPGDQIDVERDIQSRTVGVLALLWPFRNTQANQDRRLLPLLTVLRGLGSHGMQNDTMNVMQNVIDEIEKEWRN